ncbi:MAG TPA: DinB family protein [Blastocatellia bacterium]|nr:DinB family protein [Blastocatellia bacterium]
MSDQLITRPAQTEYAEYYDKYISRVADGNIITVLGQQIDNTVALLRGLSEAQAAFRYAPEKWSVKEVVGHLIDSERIFGYRALRFARNDQTPLSGFEQNDYVREASFDDQSLSDLASELEHVRRANLLLMRGLTDEAWARRGEANGNPVSVRALAYMIAGHELHHMEIVRTKYL